MGLIDFILRKLTEPRKQPEDYYTVTIANEFVRVDHPKWGRDQIKWNEINTIKIVTTNEGPFLPDFWIGLFGTESKCLIPQGARGYDEVYEIISKYEGFDFENAGAATPCTENKEFLVWTK